MQNAVGNRKKRLENLFFILVYMAGVMLMRLFYITRTTGPFIYADEFGYWSHAAHMTGNVWAGAMDGVSWYSFGYSFWLALTFLFSSRMVVMYRIAIVLNVIMSLGIYFLAYAVIRKLAREQSEVTSGFIAFAATCFPTYIFYSYTTMCETALALVIWLLFYEIISLEENPKWWKGALLGITAGYAFMVHNRLLTAVLAVAGCLIFLLIWHKIDWKTLFFFAAAIMVMLLLYIIMKNYLEGMIAANQALADIPVSITEGKANTFQSVWNKFVGLFQPDRIKRPFLSLMGQLWQCLSSTYLLAGIGGVYIVRHLVKSLRRGDSMSIYAFPLLAFVFSAGLTCITAYGPEIGTVGRVRIDAAFYGRYNECYYPMVIVMALIFLCGEERRNIWKQMLIIIAGYLALSVGMYFRLYGLDGYLNIVSAVGIHIFHWLGQFSVWKCAVTALIGGGIVAGLSSFKRIGYLGRYAGMTVLVILFFTTALYCMKTSIRGENDYTMQYAPLYDYLNENMETGEVAYIAAEGKPAYDLQSRLVDKPVAVILPENLDATAKGAYVVISEEELEGASAVNYEICMKCEEFVVIRLH